MPNKKLKAMHDFIGLLVLFYHIQVIFLRGLQAT